MPETPFYDGVAERATTAADVLERQNAFRYTLFSPVAAGAQETWASFCGRFVMSPANVERSKAETSQAWRQTLWGRFKTKHLRRPYITALVVDLGRFNDKERRARLRNDALPVPFLAYAHFEQEIRVVVPFAEPLPRSIFTIGKRRTLCLWIKRTFGAQWAVERTNTICVWTLPPWRYDRMDSAAFAGYTCAFQTKGTFASLETLLTLAAQKQTREAQ